MTHYTSRHVRELFAISHQTVKNYADEFSGFLSVTGAPGKGRTRLFTEDDLAVFALVKSLKDRGMTYADIHTALQAGQRGTVPDSAYAIVETAPSASIVALQDALEQALQDNRRLQSEVDRAGATIDELRRQLADSQAKVDRLNREIGRLESE